MLPNGIQPRSPLQEEMLITRGKRWTLARTSNLGRGSDATLVTKVWMKIEFDVDSHTSFWLIELYSWIVQQLLLWGPTPCTRRWCVWRLLFISLLTSSSTCSCVGIGLVPDTPAALAHCLSRTTFIVRFHFRFFDLIWFGEKMIGWMVRRYTRISQRWWNHSIQPAISTTHCRSNLEDCMFVVLFCFFSLLTNANKKGDFIGCKVQRLGQDVMEVNYYHNGTKRTSSFLPLHLFFISHPSSSLQLKSACLSRSLS